MSDCILGVDLGGTALKTALVGVDRSILAKDSRPSRAKEGPEAVMEVMAAAARDVIAQAGVAEERVVAAGFGAPGPMNWQSGVVYSPPNLIGWKNVPLADAMRERLGIPCFVENDANAACYGEYWLGAGRGADSIVVLTLGTGIGGGIVVFGQLLRGIDGTAGELGHIKVHRGGRMCGCGAQGCLEAYASVPGMLKTAVEALDAGRSSTLDERCGGERDKLTGEMIFEAAQAGDEAALWAFDETATWLGLGISSMIHYQNPERVILCGGMIAAGDFLFERVRGVVRKNTFEVPGERCVILPAGLGGDAGVIGAAGCALDRLNAS